MQIYELSSKQPDELMNNLLKKYKLNEEDIITKIWHNKSNTLFKADNFTIKAVKLEDVVAAIKEFLSNLFIKMDLNVTFEYKIVDKRINIKMYSDNNSILIGRNGQTLNAIQNITRQYISTQTHLLPYILLDVENYKTNKNQNIERLALRVAQEVKDTGISATLDNMNSYERRIVHNILTNFEGVTTISEGDEPNRHVIIKKIND